MVHWGKSGKQSLKFFGESFGMNTEITSGWANTYMGC